MLKEVTFTKGHVAGKQQNGDLNPGLTLNPPPAETSRRGVLGSNDLSTCLFLSLERRELCKLNQNNDSCFLRPSIISHFFLYGFPVSTRLVSGLTLTKIVHTVNVQMALG